MPWDRSRNEEEKGTKDPRRSRRGWTAGAEIYKNGEETVVPVIHMISTWKLNLYLTFKVMFMFIF